MKKTIILTMLLAFTIVSFAQQTVPNQNQQTDSNQNLQTAPIQNKQAAPNQNWKESDLYKKGKSQKTAGWILAGAGTAGLLVTMVVDFENMAEGGVTEVVTFGYAEPKYKSYTVPYLLSAAAIVGGVYLLFVGTKNKNKAKAATVFIDMEKAPVLQGVVFNNLSYPVVGVKIRL